MTEKDKFYESIKKFFDENLFREIYATEQLALFNVSECSYLGFDYEISNAMPTPYGFYLKPEELEPIMADNSVFYKLIDRISKRKLTKRVVNCGPKTFEVMKLYKQRTDLTGPTTSREFEEELMEKYGQSPR